MRASLEQQHHGGRRRGYVFGPAAECEVTLIGRMRSVDVLVCRNRVGDLANREVLRQRLLQHHAVHGRIVAKAFEPLPNRSERRRFGQLVDLDLNADPLSRFYEIADVRDARIVPPDENDVEPGMNPGFA